MSSHSFTKTFSLLALFFAAAYLQTVTALVIRQNVYKLSESIQGPEFYNAFEWETFDDPTHGRVNYVTKEESRDKNLTFAKPDTFILRADHKTFVGNKRGRDSVRIRSIKAYTNHVSVFDIRHMPQGCGTWPAVWTVQGNNWPYGGEIDILEGVNDEGTNAATLHTGPGCSISTPSTLQRGSLTQHTDCDAFKNSNIGCPIDFPSPESYGPTFNANGGGYYALERNPDHIKVWFWSRNDPSVPDEIKDGSSGVANPDSWGLPTAFFPKNQCNMQEHFGAHNIVINLTFCGDWAGQTYAQAGCPSTCVDFVDNNPWKFADAYFDMASIRIYQR